MTKTPTGTLRGNALILTRSFRAPIEDVWTSVTKSESTVRWFGIWEGDGRPGGTIRNASSMRWHSASLPAIRSVMLSLNLTR